MKKFLSILLVALFATTAMVSCDKEETSTEAAANTLVYNGKVYQMNSSYSYEQSGRVYIDASAVETTSDGQPIFHIISDNPKNGTYDLTQDDVFFGLSSEVDDIQSFFSQDGDFSAGTLVVNTDDEAFSAKLNGTLKDGIAVSYWIYVPASEWEALEW